MSVGMSTHDIELKIGSTTKGLKLVRDDEGSAMYSVQEEIPKYDRDLKFTMKNWKGGHGQYKFPKPATLYDITVEGDDIYYDGQSIDTTQPGKIFLGPLINSVGITGPAALDSDPVKFCWFSAIGKLMMATTTQIYWYDGTYWVSKNTFTDEHITDLIEYNGCLYVALDSSSKYYYSTDGANYTVTDLADGYAEKFFTCPNSAGTDNVLWKAKKPNEIASTTNGKTFSVSELTISDCESAWSDGSAGDVICTATDAYFKKGSYSSKLVVAATAGVELLAYKDLSATKNLSDYTGVKFWVRCDITTSAGDLQFLLDDTAACASPTETLNFPAITAADTWQECTINMATPANCTAIASIGVAQAVDVGACTIWIDDVRAYKTGGAGGVEWTTPAYIGDTSCDITNMFLIGDKMMIGKTDNLYHYDTDGGLHPLLDTLKHNRSTKNFQYVVDWQTAVYFSLVTGLGEITALNAFAPVGPLTEISDIGKQGTCVGLASDKDYLYVAMDEGTNTHIYKGREVNTGNKLRWEWCPWISFASATYPMTTMLVVQHTASDRRLWFGYGHNTAYVTLNDNPLATTSNYAASGFIRFSYEYGTNPYWDKMWQSVVTETAGCSATVTVTPKYRKDTDTSMAALTAAITSNGVVKTNLTAALSSKRIQFELDLATASSTSTPQVTYIEVRGHEKPETVRIHELVFSLGTQPGRSVETLRTFLRGGRTSTSLIRLADLRFGGNTAGTANTDYVYCVMLPGSPEEIEIISSKNTPTEYAMKVKLMEISYG